MSHINFVSWLSDDLNAYIIMKQASGRSFIGDIRILKKIDLMIAEEFADEDYLNKEICERWIELHVMLDPGTQKNYATTLRQFGKYLISLGKKAYVLPDNICPEVSRKPPFIFTFDELKSFFSAVDGLDVSPYSPFRHYIAPVYFRLLYTCGLRPSEGRFIAVEDVDLTTGKIRIRESKGWMERFVYVANDMLDLLQRYHLIMDKALPDRTAFFPNRHGKYWSHHLAENLFRVIWYSLPESKAERISNPHPHSFRHSYVVHRILKWNQEDRDINAYYPYLSEFLGHANFESTYYYVTLSEVFYSEIKNRMKKSNLNVLPEVPTYENYR